MTFDPLVCSCEHGGWSKYNAEKYQFITEQYPSSLPNRRAVVIDRVKRELPSMTRADIVSGKVNCIILVVPSELHHHT